MGSLPRRVDDHADRVPEDWREHGGVFIPMYQREALWICFRAPDWKPRAMKVGVGKVCAVTGQPWSDELHGRPRQDYVVVPDQPWLDGIAAGKGTIRQFVAMPLGLGYTVEGQVTGEERFGGIQLAVYDPRPGRFPDLPPRARHPWAMASDGPALGAPAAGAPAAFDELAASDARSGRRSGAMGLGAGGRMKQKVYPDRHGLGTWETRPAARVFVHIVNSELWREITGEEPPASPVTARHYAAAGLPWFDLYDEATATVEPAPALAAVKSVKQLDSEKSTLPLQDDGSVEPGPVRKLLCSLARGLGVRDGSW